MKKTLLAIAIVLVTLAAQAQIKVHDNGQVSIGSLTIHYGIQVQPNGFASFRAQSNSNYGWGNMSYSNVGTLKNWIVKDLDSADSTYNLQTFYVLGNGNVWAYKYNTFGNSARDFSKLEIEPVHQEAALSSILQLQGYYFEDNTTTTPEEIMESEYVDNEAKEAMVLDLSKRNVGLDVSNLSNVIPDAVRTCPDGRQSIDYNALVTVLVEAVKQQQTEIELLQKTLKENGLMR